MVNCQGVWVRFSKTPTIDGGSARGVAVRLDGKKMQWPVRHTIGEADMRFEFRDFVSGELIRAKGDFAIAVPWFQQGFAVFTWSTAGSTATINEIRKECRLDPI